MPAAEPHLAGLSDEHRHRLEAWLVEFDRGWNEQRLKVWLRRLPLQGDALRRPALIEMVKIDLERRWQQGQRASLESYLKVLPELGTQASVPADLILAECKVRQQFDTPLDLEALAQRFPLQVGEVRQRLAQDSAASCAASVAPAEPTPLPGQPPAARGTLPEQFGRYRILRTLGRGGMGAVYLAHDKQLDRAVALKVPHFSAEDGPGVRERFVSEARAAATLDHPNLCPIFDAGEVDGIPYLTMAYVEGQPLAEPIAAGNPLPQRDAAILVRKLAVALQEAHDRAVIHRDLKPSNIMINRRGEPIVMDFGLARRVRSDDVRLTRTGTPLGTPAYMPPEQADGDIHAMGPGCDIYSLGVILYEVLTCRRPFEGPLAVVWAQILTQEPPRLSEYRPDIDPRLEAVCLKALAKKVADRHASMSAFAAALDDYLNDSDVPADPILVSDPKVRWRPGRKVAAAGLLVAILGTAALLFAWLRGPDPRSAARAALRDGMDAIEQSDPDRAIASLDTAIRLAPDDADAWYHRGHAYAIKKNDARAIEDLSAAIRLRPTLAEAYNLRGLLFAGKGDARRALLDYSEAIRLDPRLVKAYVNRGSEYANRKQYDLALVDYSKALDIDPASVEACNGRGTVYQAWGDYDQAIREFDQALRIRPAAWVFSNRGWARACKDDRRGAILDYDQAILLDPKWAVPYANRGLAYCAEGDCDRAIEDFTEAIRLAPRTPAFYRHRAAAYKKQGKSERERADREKAEQLENTPRP